MPSSLAESAPLARFTPPPTPRRGLCGRLASTPLGSTLALAGLALVFGLLAFQGWRTERERTVAMLAGQGLEKVGRGVAALTLTSQDYLATGQPEHWQIFVQQRSDLETSLGRLGARLAQLDAPRELEAEVQRWLEHSAVPLVEARRTAQDAALRTARDAGAPLLQRIEAQVASLGGQLRARQEAARRLAGWLSYLQIACAAALAGVGLSGIVAATVRGSRTLREHLERNEAAHAQTHAIINTTLDGVITIDSHGSILSMNPAALKMFAPTEPDLIGQNISVLIAQRHLLHDMGKVGRGTLATTGQRQGYFSFPIEISYNEMTVGDRKQFVVIVRDVSERLKSQGLMRAVSELGHTGDEFLRNAIKELSKALPQEYAFVVEVTGEGDEAVSNFTLASRGSIVRSGQESLADTACLEALRKGYRCHPEGVRGKFPEDAILEQTGAESFMAMPVLDHMQRPVGLVGLIDRKPLVDSAVLEPVLQFLSVRAGGEIVRKRFEEDLAAEKERLAVTLRSIGEGFITTNNEGNVIMLNAVAESLTGWSHGQAIHRPLFDVFHLLQEKTRKRCTHALSRIVETGSSDEIHYPAILVSRDQQERLVECTTSAMRDKLGRKLGVVIVFRDVTEKMRVAEEQKKAEKLESLGLVAGGIAHDFNNVLTMIVGNVTSVLKMPGLDRRLVEHLQAATKATARAEELAKQLLPFAKGGAPILQTVSIAQLVRDTVAFTLQGSKTWAEATFPDDLWPVEVDPGQISQVIHHLVLNAEQAMPAGGNVRILAENVQLPADQPDLGLRAGRWVRLCIRDEGIGIAEEYRQKIFDPYFTTKPKGAGLGLATTHRILKNHGTGIAVESEPGMGSAFTTYLPASDAELPVAPPAATLAIQPPARVLVLDDEEAICMLLQCAFEDLGHTVTVTHDGTHTVAAYEEALRENRRFDLVVSDLSIPGGMGGKDTIKRLCEIDPEVRAIVSSGYANDPVMSRYQDFGFTGMIAKPYTIDAMCQKVTETLAQPRQARTPLSGFSTAP